jgi:hypothetical protein
VNAGNEPFMDTCTLLRELAVSECRFRVAEEPARVKGGTP